MNKRAFIDLVAMVAAISTVHIGLSFGGILGWALTILGVLVSLAVAWSAWQRGKGMY